MKFILLALFILFSSSFSFANEDTVCGERNEIQGPYIFTRQFFNPSACFLSVRPSYAPTLIYRSFIFRETGKLLVFNSYGPGDSSKKTGARVFHFFPRNQLPNFSLNGTDVTVMGAQKDVNFSFNSVSGQIASSPTLEISEDSQIHAKNKGGVEISYFHGLLLDSGFSLGVDPTSNLAGKSIFRDEKNNQCQVSNSEIFTEDNDGDIVFKLSDQSLKKFLTYKCPAIGFDF